MPIHTHTYIYIYIYIYIRTHIHILLQKYLLIDLHMLSKHMLGERERERDCLSSDSQIPNMVSSQRKVYLVILLVDFASSSTPPWEEAPIQKGIYHIYLIYVKQTSNNIGGQQ